MKMGTSRGKGMGPSTLGWQGGPDQPADLQPAPDSTGCQPSMGAGLREKKIPTDRKNMGVTVAAPLSAVDHNVCCLSPNARPLPERANVLRTSGWWWGVSVKLAAEAGSRSKC